YTFAEGCGRASCAERTAKRLWRALGFPDPPEHERLFRDEDVEAIITLRRLIESATVPRGEDYAELVQNVRVIGGALARIAEVQSDSLVEMTRSELATGRTASGGRAGRTRKPPPACRTGSIGTACREFSTTRCDFSCAPRRGGSSRSPTRTRSAPRSSPWASSTSSATPR